MVSMQGKPNGEVAKRLSGAWRYVGSRVDGKPLSGRGANPQGLIYYDPSGQMGVHVAPDLERGRAGSEATAEEAKAALKGYASHFGTSSIDEQARTVTHHRTSSVQP